MTVSFNTDLVSLTLCVFQSTFTFVVFVPSWYTLVTIFSNQVILLTVQKGSCTLSVAKSLSFLTTSERISDLKTFSILNSGILIQTTEANSWAFIIVITERWYFDAEETIFRRNFSFRTVNLLTNAEIGGPPANNTLYTSGSCLFEHNTFLRNILTLLSILILSLKAVNDNRLASSIFLKLIIINARCTQSISLVELSTKIRNILACSVDHILPISTFNWNLLTNSSSTNSTCVELACQTIASEVIVSLTSIWNWKASSEMEILSVRTSVIVKTRSIYQVISSEASQASEIHIIVVDTRKAFLSTRDMVTWLHVLISVRVVWIKWAGISLWVKVENNRSLRFSISDSKNIETSS